MTLSPKAKTLSHSMLKYNAVIATLFFARFASDLPELRYQTSINIAAPVGSTVGYEEVLYQVGTIPSQYRAFAADFSISGAGQ